MFSPPKRHAIATVMSLAAVGWCLITTADAQTDEFSRRMAVMQQARARAQQAMQASNSAQVPVNQRAPVNAATPRQNVVQASAQVEMDPSMMPPRMASQGQVTRTAQLSEQVIIDGGAPFIEDETYFESEPMSGGFIARRRPILRGRLMGRRIVDDQVMAEPYFDGEVVDGCSDGNCGGCDTCGEIGGYFDGDCCGRGGGCPPGQPCWLNGLGKIFCNAEYFGGFTSFRSTLFQSPVSSVPSLVDDCSFGGYAGFNTGIPLCRLTCGLFSGQFGLRTVNTNLDGNAFSTDSRNQLFMTAGFYRRVDYGLQVGVVADLLREEWFTTSETVQIRGDLGYVWPAGTTFGFRFAKNVQDEVVAGTFNGQTFDNMIVASNDNYRFYLRHDAARGGYGEFFAGWSELKQGIIGLDFDMPITDRLAFEAGFTYFMNDDGVPPNAGFEGGDQADAFNTFVGVSFRPRGRSHYRSYDRPLFDVADNGSMMTTRQ